MRGMTNKALADKLVNDMRKKLINWGKTPIFVPRWMLSAKYAGFIVMGILFLLWGNTTLTLATFDLYTILWACGVIATATLSLPGSIHERFESVERWSALILGGLILTWSAAAIWRAFAEGDFSRIPGAWAVLLVGMFPMARSFGLLRTVS